MSLLILRGVVDSDVLNVKKVFIAVYEMRLIYFQISLALADEFRVEAGALLNAH